MGGMIHEVDVSIAEGLRDVELPEHPARAVATWRHTLNDAVVRWWSANGVEIADLNELDRLGHIAPIEFCFPNTFLLPMFSSASAYRFRPVGPEETLMEIWSLTRFPRHRRTGPADRADQPPDAPTWPPIPSQDFANIPKQQEGLHSRSVEFMRLAERIEGLISNFERVDGYLAGVPDEQLVRVIQQTNGPIDVPIAEFDFSGGSGARRCPGPLPRSGTRTSGPHTRHHRARAACPRPRTAGTGHRVDPSRRAARTQRTRSCSPSARAWPGRRRAARQ